MFTLIFRIIEIYLIIRLIKFAIDYFSIKQDYYKAQTEQLKDEKDKG